MTRTTVIRTAPAAVPRPAAFTAIAVQHAIPDYDQGNSVTVTNVDQTAVHDKRQG